MRYWLIIMVVFAAAVGVLANSNGGASGNPDTHSTAPCWRGREQGL